MKGRLLIRPAAVEDLDGHVEYIARDRVSAAMRLFDAVHEEYRRLAAEPGLGAPCEWINPRIVGLRRWTVHGFKNYVIYYREMEDGIEVVRLLHGGRDRESILRREQA